MFAALLTMETPHSHSIYLLQVQTNITIYLAPTLFWVLYSTLHELSHLILKQPVTIDFIIAVHFSVKKLRPRELTTQPKSTDPNKVWS
jgi:hypothetical protein